MMMVDVRKSVLWNKNFQDIFREKRGLDSGYAQVAVPVKVPAATLGCSVTS